MLLTLEEGRVLVKAARRAIMDHIAGKPNENERNIDSELRKRRGVFITLLDHSNSNELRGCIGIPLPTLPLIEQVKIAAIEAATSDPRFDPVEINELKERISVEATILSEMEPIWVKNPLDLRENVVVGRDGLMVEGMGSHGLLLPQVAVDEGFDSEEFLSQCCLKASLPPDAWLTGQVQVSRFQGQVFAEEEPDGGVIERRFNSKSGKT